MNIDDNHCPWFCCILCCELLGVIRMALHLSANGCYGVMIYNNRDYPDEFLRQMLSKYGTIQSYNRGGQNFIFVYYKHYEEARGCLDELKNTADFNAKPARPRETNRGEPKPGYGFGKFRSKSMSKLNFSNGDTRKEMSNNNKNKDDVPKEQSNNLHIDKDERKSRCDDGPRGGFRPRSKSVSRVDIEDANRRADLIKKVIASEQNGEDMDCNFSDLSIGGSFDSLVERVNQLEKLTRRPKPLPRIRIPEKEPPVSNTPKQPEIDLSLVAGEEEFEDQPSIIPVQYFYDRQFIVLKKAEIVVIGGLPYCLTLEDLCGLCSRFTRVLRIKMVDPKSYGEALRAYVYVESEEEVDILVRRLNKKLLSNNIIIAFSLSDAL